MGFIEIFLIAVSLAMDAFAVSISRGLAMKKDVSSDAFIVALFFGGFQALMPLAGWLFGIQFEKYILEYDHWLAFILLASIGSKMIYDVKNQKDDEIGSVSKLDFKKLFLLAVATSIDALAVGVTLAFLDTPILQSSMLIGIITFIISYAGVLVGSKFGTHLKKKAEFAGGMLLIIIGTNILLEHLGFISF